MKGLQDVYFSNLNAVCNTGGFFSLPEGGHWTHPDLHRFSQNKFYFVTKGRCRITVEGTEYIASAGDWFFIPRNALHSYSDIDGESFEKYWMHFDLYPSDELFSLLNLPYMVNVSDRKEPLRLFKSYAEISKGNDLTDKITIKSYLFSLIAEYIYLAHPDVIAVQSRSDSRIDEILRYINNNLDKPLSVPELSAQFHLHPNHFIRFFKEKTGETPAKYIKVRKLETAKRLIESTDLYITEIMEKIGMSDPCQFSKQFKAFYSYSPRQYRNYFKNDMV
ncbi:MAG: helix-turn-helix transcriptional regulator [Clostridia bacterium]|nr:helix-turn-helix transcriptional regulator [Clostridia bacterium]